MKVAIYGQYYLNSVEPIKEIFSFFNSNNLEIIIETEFLKVLYEKNIVHFLISNHSMRIAIVRWDKQ